MSKGINEEMMERIIDDVEDMESALMWIRQWVPEVEKYTAALKKFDRAKEDILKALKDA